MRCGFPPFSANRTGTSHNIKHHRVNRKGLTRHTLGQVVPASCPCIMHIVSSVLRSGNSSSVTAMYTKALTLESTNIPVGGPMSNVTVKLVSRGGNRGCTVLSSVLKSRSRLNSVSFGMAKAGSNVATARVSVGMSNLSCRVLRGTLTRTGRNHVRVLNGVVRTRPRIHPSLGPRTPEVRAVAVNGRFVNTMVNPNNGVVRNVRRGANTIVAVRRRSKINGVRVSKAGGTAVSTTVHSVGTVITIPRVNRVCRKGVSSVVPCNTFIRFVPNGSNLLRVSRVS